MLLVRQTRQLLKKSNLCKCYQQLLSTLKRRSDNRVSTHEQGPSRIMLGMRSVIILFFASSLPHGQIMINERERGPLLSVNDDDAMRGRTGRMVQLADTNQRTPGEM